MKQSVMMGTTVQAFELPDQNLLGVLKPNEVKVNLKGEASVRDALKNPIASLKLNDLPRFSLHPHRCRKFFSENERFHKRPSKHQSHFHV